VLPDESPLKQQKQSRLQQINDYIALVSKKKGGFISLREEILKKPSNLYGILLRPRVQDHATKVKNPIFSLNRQNDSSGDPLSLLFNSLQRHLSNIKFAKPSPRQQLLDAVATDLENKDAILSTNERLIELQQTLTEKANTLFHTALDFTTAGDGKKIDIKYLNDILGDDLTEHVALDGLLGACAQGFFETCPESPFYAASRERPDVQLEKLSIMTQFFLATINVYCMSHGLTTVNFGAILDGNQALSDELTQTIKQSLENGEDVENNICRFIEKHRDAFQLPQNTRLNTQQIKEKFIRTYLTVKDSPHMDEFLLLDLEAPNAIFVTHQGSICTDITLLVQEQELTNTLRLNKLDFIDSHPNEVPAQNPSVSATDKLDIPLEPLLEKLANQNVNLNQYSGLIENIIEALFHACIENSLTIQTYNNFCKIIGGKKPDNISNPPTVLDLLKALSENNKTSLITKITTQIAQLKPEKQLELFQQKNRRGETLLAFILLNASQSLEPFLPVIEKMDKKLIFSILTTLDSQHMNVLMFAAKHQPKGVKHLLKLIEKLEQEEKYAIFSQTNNWWGYGDNALMLAARYHPQAIEPIVIAMQELTLEQKFALLSKTDSYGWNTLIFAARYHPQAVEQILNGMQGLSQEQKFKILTQTNEDDYNPDGYNALKIAAQYQPQALEHILKAMLELSQEKTYQILSQTANTSIMLRSIIIRIILFNSEIYYSNALMFAARNHPKAVEPILNAMQELTRKQKFALLSKTDFYGRNALMLAAQYHPQAVEPILKSLSQLPADYQYQFFRKKPLDKLEQLFVEKSITPNPILMSFLKLNAYRPKAKDLKTQAAVAKIEQLSQMYQQEKDIIPSDINLIWDRMSGTKLRKNKSYSSNRYY